MMKIFMAPEFTFKDWIEARVESTTQNIQSACDMEIPRAS